MLKLLENKVYNTIIKSKVPGTDDDNGAILNIFENIK